MSLTDEQAHELGTAGRKLSIIMATMANEFCQNHKLAESEQAFNASMFTLIETLMFVTLTSIFPDDPTQQRKTADELHRGVRKMLRDYAIHKQLHPKGKTQ